MPNKGTFPNRQYFIDNTNHAEPNKDFRWIERKGPNKGNSPKIIKCIEHQVKNLTKGLPVSNIIML